MPQIFPLRTHLPQGPRTLDLTPLKNRLLQPPFGAPRPFSTSSTRSSSAAQWSGTLYTFSGDDFASPGNPGYMRTNDSFSGDFSLAFKLFAFSGSTSACFGVYPISSDASFNPTAGADNAGLGALAGMYEIYNGGSIRHANSEVATTGITSGDSFLIRRTGISVAIFRNNMLVHAFAAPSSGAVRTFTGTQSGGAALDIRDISWTF